MRDGWKKNDFRLSYTGIRFLEIEKLAASPKSAADSGDNMVDIHYLRLIFGLFSFLSNVTVKMKKTKKSRKNIWLPI